MTQKSLDLSMVMPVYNEEACIVEVVNSWHSMLSELGIKFQIIVLNDGSTDSTKDVLDGFADNNEIIVISKKNSGHGSTILTGYKQAALVSEWVFQCDSDDEMKPDHFPILWQQRENYDALFGIRDGRDQNIGRKFISACSRFTIRLLYGRGVSDVNTPYRLMRSDILSEIVHQIPDDTFAPNIIISGVFAKSGCSIFEHQIIHKNRTTGTVSIVKWRLWRAAIKSLWQTLTCRPVLSMNKKTSPN